MSWHRQALLHELRTGERCSVPDDYAPSAEQDEDSEPSAPEGEPSVSADRPDGQQGDGSASDAARALEDGPLARAALARCRVVFCTGDAEALISRPKLAGAMHAITVGTAHAKLLTQGLEALAAEHCALAVEVCVAARLCDETLVLTWHRAGCRVCAGAEAGAGGGVCCARAAPDAAQSSCG